MQKHKFPWGAFITSFKHIDTYEAHLVNTKASFEKEFKQRPAITIAFKSPYMAKIFLYWVMILGGTNMYESNVYLEDVLPEVYEGIEDTIS